MEDNLTYKELMESESPTKDFSNERLETLLIELFNSREQEEISPTSELVKEMKLVELDSYNEIDCMNFLQAIASEYCLRALKEKGKI